MIFLCKFRRPGGKGSCTAEIGVLGAVIAAILAIILIPQQAIAQAAKSVVDLNGCEQCVAPGVEGIAHAGPSSTGIPFIDFFTGGGNYMPRTHCLTTAEGKIDWPWIIALLVLSAGVIVAYLKIFVFWMKSYFGERAEDRNRKLFDLAAVFLLCAICGYGMSMLMFAWPGYRLLAGLLLLLNVFSWRFCYNLAPFQVAFAAGRLDRELRESIESRSRELERLVAIRTAEANRLAEIARRTDNAVVITGRNGCIEWVNEGFTRMTGYTAAEVTGKKPGHVLQGPESDVTESRRMSEAVRRGEKVTAELVNYTKEHRKYIARIEIAPLYDEAGELSGFMSMESDVTEARRHDAVLREAQLAAESASHSKSAFLANMSHEIRTPMTAILGFTDLLTQEGDNALAPEARVEYIRTIKRNGEHLLTIINDILDLSKIEAGKMSFERIAVKPVQVLSEVQAMMQVKARDKGLTLEVVGATDIPALIQSDPVRLKQVLVNLVGNAIKFTVCGGVKIVVGLDTSCSDCPRLSFEVRDSGIGMSPSEVHKLFRAFEQADASTTRKHGGTGLGLRISKTLAKMLGGDIDVTSTVGAGSSFRFTVQTGPLDEVEMVALGASTVELSGNQVARDDGGAGPERLKGIRVYLAEDGPDNQRLIAFYLRKAGAEVTIFKDGKLAAQALTQDGTVEGLLKVDPPCDVLLTDMQMPELDGYGLARLMRSKGWTRPIVALTAHAMAGDAEKCLAAGCDRYASKPIDKNALIAACLPPQTMRTAA